VRSHFAESRPNLKSDTSFHTCTLAGGFQFNCVLFDGDIFEFVFTDFFSGVIGYNHGVLPQNCALYLAVAASASAIISGVAHPIKLNLGASGTISPHCIVGKLACLAASRSAAFCLLSSSCALLFAVILALDELVLDDGADELEVGGVATELDASTLEIEGGFSAIKVMIKSMKIL